MDTPYHAPRSADEQTPSAETNAIVERIRGSKRMVEVPGVGHDMPYVYRAPDLWVQTVKQFLAQQVATLLRYSRIGLLRGVATVEG